MGLNLLKEVVNRASKLPNIGYKLEDPDFKESHYGKTLSKHVSECCEISSQVCRIFGLEDRFVKFSDILCSLHDLGKLHPNWRLDTRNVKHSLRGEDILKRLKGDVLSELTGLSKEEQSLLIFMVRKHHMALRLKDFKEFQNISWLNDKPELSIGYADSFGAFKLADFASSIGMGERILEVLRKEWPSEDSITSLFYKIDLEKLSYQRRISSSLSHVALTAPTGWGKTAVGILSSIISSPVKLFYALPTITAIRKMSDKLRKLLGMSDPITVGEYFYFVDVDLFKDSGDDEEESRLLDFYRLFVPKINLITVDQLLLPFMRAGKYHMRRFELRRSVVVIDEYHLLPAPMIGALAEVLGFYVPLYKIKVVLMTATPSSAYREVLISSLKNCKVYDLSEEYGKLRRHRMELIGGIEDGLELVKNLVDDGKRVLVILNTVKRARDFYKKLDIPSKLLLHSRFTVNDRYEKERSIEEVQVLVSTQVAEVSLDVSFDSLISDPAPIPSIIQRAGRVNRYGGENVSKPNIYVMENIESPEPYYKLEIDYSLDVLKKFAPKLENEGEKVYLEMLKEYDGLVHDYLLSEVNSYREKLRERVFKGNQLAALSLDEESLIRDLRGEANVLVVPSCYEEKVRELLARRREASSYEEKVRLWAEIKGYLVPVELWVALKHGKDAEGIPLKVIREGDGTYDPELGLLLKEAE